MIERRARADMIDAIDAADPIDNTDTAEPIDPIDNTDPTEPTDSTDPRHPMQRNESSDHSDHFELIAQRLLRARARRVGHSAVDQYPVGTFTDPRVRPRQRKPTRPADAKKVQTRPFQTEATRSTTFSSRPERRLSHSRVEE
jgi:hypothetical protein